MRVWMVALVAALVLAGQPPTFAQEIQLAQADRPLVSGERVRVKKIVRDVASAMQTLDQGGVKPFQDPAYVAKWQQSLQRYKDALARYPQLDDPDVQAAAAKIAEFENMIAFGMQQGQAQTEALGDVQAILAGLEQNLRSLPKPAWLPFPFDDAEAQAWVDQTKAAKQQALAAAAELERIAPTANLPNNPGTVQQGAPYDMQDLDRLYRYANGIATDADAAAKETLDRLKSQFDAQNMELDYFRSIDPEDEHHRMNAYLQEGAAERIYGRLDKQLAFARSVTAYQRAFGREPSQASLQRVAEIEALRTQYAADRQSAVGASRLPEPAAQDAARIEIARAILAEPSYEFGEHGPIILTTPEIVEREKDVSRAEIKDVDVSLSGEITLSGTETTWHYKWQEFKFATPMRHENGEWYIWWITAKNYSSGWERTPIGQWISGRTTQGDLILEENF